MTVFSRILSTVAMAAAFVSCEKPGDRIEITDTANRSETRPVPRVNATSAERFALAVPENAPAPGHPAASPVAAPTPAATSAPAGQSMFDYEIPSGWTQGAPSQFRDPNFTIGPNAEIECYVSVLQGQGGGMLVNANRWRGQLGQAPYTDAEFGALPRASILGRDAYIVDFTGSYLGMGQTEAKPGYRLVGALIEAPMAAVFIKMVGPDAMVEAEKDNFAHFAQSLRMKGGNAPMAPVSAPAADAGASPGAAQEPAAAAPATPAAPSKFSWNAPETWTESPASSPMRLVTFNFGANNEGECYVAALPGQAGGRLENFNRWLAQMGEPPLEETELALQPPVFMFGEEVPMLIAKGTYAGMGGESRPGHVLFGALAEVDGESVFVKLIAPEALGSEHMQKFAAFCASLRKNP